MPDDVCSKMICGEGESDLWRLQKIWHHDGSSVWCPKGPQYLVLKGLLDFIIWAYGTLTPCMWPMQQWQPTPLGDSKQVSHSLPKRINLWISSKLSWKNLPKHCILLCSTPNAPKWNIQGPKLHVSVRKCTVLRRNQLQWLPWQGDQRDVVLDLGTCIYVWVVLRDRWKYCCKIKYHVFENCIFGG